MEFKIIEEPQSFSDIKAIKQEQGDARNVTFYCETNQGPELYCCLTNAHGEIMPDWLSQVWNDEDEQEFNSGRHFKVIVDDSEVSFEEIDEDEDDYDYDENDEDEDDDDDDERDDDEYQDVEDMDYYGNSITTYFLSDVSPDFIILDAEASRIKINLDGYVLDNNNQPTSERIINIDELPSEQLNGFATKTWEQEVTEWLHTTVKEDFSAEKLKFRVDDLIE
jgi:hypothetical protein